MKDIMLKKRYLLIVIFCAFMCASCGSNSEINNAELTMKQFYDMEDFSTIVVGESTYNDVYAIAPFESIYSTSYGGMCEFPTKDGGVIRIKFLEDELVVGSIEEIFVDGTKIDACE